MAYLTYLLCVALIQLSTGNIATLNGQAAINAQRPYLGNILPDARLMSSNVPSARGLGGMPVTNPLARNVANANTLAPGSIPRANTNPYIANGNFANNLANANFAASIEANHIAKPNLATAANLVNFGFGNQVRPANIANPTLPGSMASSIALSKYQSGGLLPQNYGNNAIKNAASNLANGNLANTNIANLANNGWYQNMAIGNSYSQSLLNGPPDNQQYGVYIQADGLEIAGNVAVTGSMPLYGTVSLNGRIPTEGSGMVNYACSG